LGQVQQAVRHRIGSVIDLFATPLTASHYVELVNPLWSSHRLQARVMDVRDETSDSRTLTLKPGRNWRSHRAGQHIRVGVPIGGMQYTRTYSISSSPERRDGRITITVKILNDGRMSGHLVRNLRPGAYLPIGLPQGDFRLPEAMPMRPLFITAGSGVTPVMSMLRTYAAVGNVPDVVHVHYAPHENDVIFGSELQQLADRFPSLYHFHPVYTQEIGHAVSDDRHFTSEQLEDLCPDWREREIWVCGPQSLIEAVETHAVAAGRARHLHIERFRAALAPLGSSATGGTVTFRHAGREVLAEADGATSLLRVAEDAGLNPAHGCRMGICHTCDIPLLAGQVRDLRTGAVGGEPGQLVQICISAAAGPSTLAV
jgi:stearoyl-CoA 9-desaturase NADPH oxidoreductase